MSGHGNVMLSRENRTGTLRSPFSHVCTNTRKCSDEILRAVEVKAWKRGEVRLSEEGNGRRAVVL